MSRSDYDDMPSGNGRRNGKGSRNMAVGLLIAILVILIIIVVKLIVSPEEKIEALPPVSSQSIDSFRVSCIGGYGGRGEHFTRFHRRF